MEKLNVFLLIVIFIYLIYSFLNRSEKTEKKEDIKNIKKNKENEKIDEYYVSAIIAMIMGEKKYRIKRIFIKGKEDKKNSFWKITGRNENMIKTRR